MPEGLVQGSGRADEVDRAGTAVPVTVSADPSVRRGERERAVAMVSKMIGHLGEPVLFAAVRLTLSHDPAVARPAGARVTLDVNGRAVRVHVVAAHVAEAVDLLEGRLRHALEHLASRQRALRRRGPASEAGEWRHGDAPTRRPPHYVRPADERQVVRRKAFALGEMTPVEAASELDLLDYDFFLFRDLATGQDAVVHRAVPGAVAVRYLHGTPPPSADDVAWVGVEPVAAPAMSLDEAVAHIDVAAEPWVFFADTSTGRGHLLYARYDGHLGLLVPADEAPTT